MIDIRDIHWLSGLLEGEGCFYTKSNETQYKAPTAGIVLSTTDRDVAQRAHLIMGSKRRIYEVADNRSERYKPVYRIDMSGRLAAGWMMTLYPLMGARRRAKILECLSNWRKSVPTLCSQDNPHGRKLSDEQVVNIFHLVESGVPMNKVAKEYGVNVGSIAPIVSGHTYTSATAHLREAQ